MRRLADRRAAPTDAERPPMQVGSLSLKHIRRYASHGTAVPVDAVSCSAERLCNVARTLILAPRARGASIIVDSLIVTPWATAAPERAALSSSSSAAHAATA